MPKMSIRSSYCSTRPINTLVLTKTNQKMEDEEGNMLDVWILSFEAASQDEGDEA